MTGGKEKPPPVSLPEKSAIQKKQGDQDYNQGCNPGVGDVFSQKAVQAYDGKSVFGICLKASASESDVREVIHQAEHQVLPNFPLW
jgi:hypothetical protein